MKPLLLIDVDGPNWRIEPRQYSIRTHGPDACGGMHCCIHSPSNHHMNTWPLVHRMDRQVYSNGMVLTLSERTCPHGIGHPDPDSLDWLAIYSNRDTWAIHGCDGCCRPASRKSQALAEMAVLINALIAKKSQRVYGRLERGLAREVGQA